MELLENQIKQFNLEAKNSACENSMLCARKIQVKCFEIFVFCHKEKVSYSLVRLCVCMIVCLCGCVLT